MSDYIKREDAIKALKGWKISGEMILGAVPAADVRKNIKSTWHYDGKFYYKCRKCGYAASFRFNFCPNCGAQMER